MTVVTTYLPSNKCSDSYPSLFGTMMVKNGPLFIVAENIFYHMMGKMVKGYKGGSYVFLKVETNLVDIEPSGFMPLIANDQERIVQVESEFEAAEMSYAAACAVVWQFTLQVIADTIHRLNEQQAVKIYKTLQDFQYCRAEMTKPDGSKLFTETDLKAIYKLTN